VKLKPVKLIVELSAELKTLVHLLNVLPGKEGLCHISELADFRVNKTEDICKLGDEIIVKCIGIDDKGRVKLSRKAAMDEAKPRKNLQVISKDKEEKEEKRSN
jgi:polyribonucleotide nucleotidyltransferase